MYKYVIKVFDQVVFETDEILEYYNIKNIMRESSWRKQMKDCY